MTLNVNVSCDLFLSEERKPILASEKISPALCFGSGSKFFGLPLLGKYPCANVNLSKVEIAAGVLLFYGFGCWGFLVLVWVCFFFFGGGNGVGFLFVLVCFGFFCLFVLPIQYSFSLRLT